jgi:trehalose/maltose hydrolase-like predicted phosphorylase
MHDRSPSTLDPWVLSYDACDPNQEGLREALCALGNGLFVTRGAAEEAKADGIHYPGTYVAGGYNQLESEVAGRTVVNEDLVNVPNWLPLTFRPEGGEWLRPDAWEILSCRQELRLAEGILLRRIAVRHPDGRESTIESRRLVHMRTPHLAAIDYRITPVNWSGRIHIRSAIDGSVRNLGVARYRQLSNRHLEVVAAGTAAPEGVYLLARTTQSRFEVAEAARTRLFRGEARIAADRVLLQEEPEQIGEELRTEISQGETLRIEKVVALYSSRHRAITEPALEARLAIARAPDFDTLLGTHRLAWLFLWRRFDLELEGIGFAGEPLAREQLILRLHVFHLLQTVSGHTVGLDVGVPARGLHGEAYRGHIFWDEIFILPFYIDRAPSITRSLLLYRYYRLGAARELASASGYAGAAFPWQSSSDGREATQQLHLNPRSGRWDPDHSHLQRHVNAGIAHNIWHYYHATGDREFLLEYGAEMLVEIARFWSSLSTPRAGTDRFEIVGVMGPDEYHEKYPDADTGGLRNNAYTNVMAVWCLLRALDVLNIVGAARRTELLAMLAIPESEVERWQAITRRMFVPFHGGGIISQFEGYDALAELDWDAYRRKYGNIQRLDRILRAEGDSPDRYRLSKQADMDMLFYVLDGSEVKDIFARLGYPIDDAAIRRNIEYYSARTSHGSTLSRVVYASTIHYLDCDEGCQLFLEALRSDVDDLQGGTTAEGIHLGAMAGTVSILYRHYAGLHLGPDGLHFDPDMPERFQRLAFRTQWRGRWVDVDLTPARLRLRADGDREDPVPVRVGTTIYRLGPGETTEIPLPSEATAGGGRRVRPGPRIIPGQADAATAAEGELPAGPT